VFGVTFRTPPRDSTGVAHILEHAVLCGSRKYPVKEPFVELMKGSLNTFLNAMTFPDKTCYPVASQNLRDFLRTPFGRKAGITNSTPLTSHWSTRAWFSTK
jgi:Zn-dependent M16 (insulinase) family peptidase